MLQKHEPLQRCDVCKQSLRVSVVPPCQRCRGRLIESIQKIGEVRYSLHRRIRIVGAVQNVVGVNDLARSRKSNVASVESNVIIKELESFVYARTRNILSDIPRRKPSNTSYESRDRTTAMRQNDFAVRDQRQQTRYDHIKRRNRRVLREIQHARYQERIGARKCLQPIPECRMHMHRRVPLAQLRPDRPERRVPQVQIIPVIGVQRDPVGAQHIQRIRDLIQGAVDIRERRCCGEKPEGIGLGGFDACDVFIGGAGVIALALDVVGSAFVVEASKYDDAASRIA